MLCMLCVCTVKSFYLIFDLKLYICFGCWFFGCFRSDFVSVCLVVLQLPQQPNWLMIYTEVMLAFMLLKSVCHAQPPMWKCSTVYKETLLLIQCTLPEQRNEKSVRHKHKKRWQDGSKRNICESQKKRFYLSEKKREKMRQKEKAEGKKKKTGRKRGQMSEQGFSSAVGVKENATNNEMSILPTSSRSLALLRLFSSGPHYQCTWTRG